MNTEAAWVLTCKDRARVDQEVAKAAASARPDLRKAAQRVTDGLAKGDKREVYLALHDIDPPCAYMFDYTVE